MEPGAFASSRVFYDWKAGAVDVSTGIAVLVEVPLRTWRGRIRGGFETSKCFPLPGVRAGMQAMAAFSRQHPGMPLVISCHADAAGSEAYNLSLTEKRGRALKALLERNVDAWLEFYSGGQLPFERWGIREDQHMLRTLPSPDAPFYEGAVNGINDSTTQRACAAFQASNNESRGSRLAVDGLLGPMTRKELVRSYMEFLVPEGAFGETFIHAGGELHPDASLGESADPLQRRIELFLFEPALVPPPEPCGPIPCSTYEVWCLRMRELFDVGLQGALVQAVVLRWDTLPMTGSPIQVSTLEGRLGAGHTDTEGVVTVVFDEPPQKLELSCRWSEVGQSQTSEGVPCHLEVGPIDTEEGVRRRLDNLGFYQEPLVEALGSFQRLQGLEQTEVADEETRRRLDDVYEDRAPLVPPIVEFDVPDGRIDGGGPVGSREGGN